MMRVSDHRIWLSLLALTIFVLAVALPALRYVADGQADRAKKLSHEREAVEISLRQLEDDITSAHALASQMNIEEAERTLAPVDRLQIAAMLEKQASTARISQFIYYLSPEQSASLDSTVSGLRLVASELSLSGDAALDTDVYNFVERARLSLPGRARLKQMTIERKNDERLSMANIHFSADIEWLSNGARNSLVAGP